MKIILLTNIIFFAFTFNVFALSPNSKLTLNNSTLQTSKVEFYELRDAFQPSSIGAKASFFSILKELNIPFPKGKAISVKNAERII